MTITYNNTECTVLSTDLKASLILIENKAGIREPFLQRFITQEEFQRAVKNKPEPKTKKGQPWRLFYNGKALNTPTTWIICSQKRDALMKTGEYKLINFKIEQK